MYIKMNSPKKSPHKTGNYSCLDNNFKNYLKNNLKMNKIKQSVKKTNQLNPREYLTTWSLNENTQAQDLRITQYPIIKPTSRLMQLTSQRNKLQIYEHNLNRPNVEDKLYYETENKNLTKNKNLNRKINLENEKRNLFKKVAPKYRLFNKEKEMHHAEIVDTETLSSSSKKELISEIEAKRSKIVEKLKKKNFYESVVKLPNVCIKSNQGEEGMLSINYPKITDNLIEDKTKRNKSTNLYKKNKIKISNNEEDGNAIFKRIFEKNFKLADKTLVALNF